MARILKPPTPLPAKLPRRSVFLAGSIEMGAAENWQEAVAAALSDLDVCLLNPRRDAWDPRSAPELTNPEFRGQVEWELEGQERADLIAMYFAPATRAPITLLELGLFARAGKVIVGCPDGFWRKGNVEVVCARYGVPLAETVEAMVGQVRERLAALGSPR